MKIKKNSPNLTKINEFKIGKKVQGFFICIEKKYRLSKNGSPYLTILLSDKSGKIEGKIWDNVDHFSSKFDLGNPVAIKGIPIEFNGQIQLSISQISHAKPEIYNKYGFDPKLLIPAISENSEKIFEKILIQIKKIKTPDLKDLCLKIFTINRDKILNSPASLKNHYPIKGGLILHIFNCLQFGFQCLKNYKFLDKDLLITGLLLHDIGKIKCYTGDYVFTESEESKLIGHDVLGLEIVNNSIKEISNFSLDLKNKISHILFFQHKSKIDGNKNWQKIPEAIAVFNINRIDAELDIMSRLISDTHGLEKDWTNGNHHFINSIFI